MAAGTETTTRNDTSRTTRDAIIVDLGRKSGKLIKRLRRGKGKLIDEVNHSLNELRTAGAITGTVQPVIVVIKEKATRDSMLRNFFMMD